MSNFQANYELILKELQNLRFDNNCYFKTDNIKTVSFIIGCVK